MRDVTELYKEVAIFLKKNTVILLILGALAFVYLVTRLYHLTELPIFTDEAIYIRWSQIARWDANWRFISLTDGKQPSYVWIAMILIRFFDDPLFAGRLVSVLSGISTLIGLFFLAKTLFKNAWIGLITSFLYSIYPMALVYDKLALYDSLVTSFMVWSLYVSILLVRYLRLDTALILGMVTGAGVLTKSSAFFSIYLLPFTLPLFHWREKGRVRQLLKWGVLALVSALLTYAIYNILRLSPFFHIINEKNEIFVHSIPEWLRHPFRDFVSNFNGLFDWFIIYFTLPFIALAFGSFFIKKTFFREKLVLTLWFLVPFFALALIGKLLYPRYILFMTAFLLPLVAYSLFCFYEKAKSIYVFVFLCVIALFLPLRTDYFLLANFPAAPIPKLDLDQYSNEWPSGGGVLEAVQFFQEKAKNQKIFVATEGTFGLMPYALEIYLKDNPNITIFGFWPVGEPPVEMSRASKKMPTYVLFYQPCGSCLYSGDAPDTWPLKKIFEKQKPGGTSSLSVYQVMP